jgi:hypothetical protein
MKFLQTLWKFLFGFPLKHTRIEVLRALVLGVLARFRLGHFLHLVFGPWLRATQ